MLSIPSVGSVVSGVLLNKDATKAKITFDDGCSIIIGVNNKGVLVDSSKTKTKVKTKKLLKKKQILPESIQQSRVSKYTVNNYAPPSPTSYKTALARAQSRQSKLAESTMTASEKLGMASQDGQEIDLNSLGK